MGRAFDPSSAAAASLAAPLSAEEASRTVAELQGLQEKLVKLQGENPLIFPCVDAQSVASVVPLRSSSYDMAPGVKRPRTLPGPVVPFNSVSFDTMR